MTQIIRQLGQRRPVRAALYVLPAILMVAALAWLPGAAIGGVYTTPFWTQNSTSPECGGCTGCGCPTPSEWSPEGVSYRTGELMMDHFIMSMPGVLSPNAIGIRWRSMNGGVSQMGRSILPSWETTAEKKIINPGNPNGPNGHDVWIRRPAGVIDVFNWTGTAYTPASCLVYDTLTIGGGGNYVLTDKYGNALAFDANGMPNTYTDRNGNVDTWTYDANLKLTGYTDDRGKAWTISSNANGFISSIMDPAGRTWTFTYDASDNLKTILTPTTADQPSGITTTFNYDGSNRLSSITDGRGNTVRSFAYVGATAQVSSVTIAGNAVSFVYGSGMTTRTDRLGNVHRVYYTGQTITSTDMLVGGVAKYTRQYRYNGSQLVNSVTPRGSRTEYTYDATGNITQIRRKTTDTATNAAADLVQQWTFSPSTNMPLTFTDSEGHTWNYSVDGAGNRVSVTPPDVTVPVAQTASESWTYNSKGQVLTHTDEEGILTTYEYFASGASKDLRSATKLGPVGSQITTSVTYDDEGNVLTRTDGNGNTFENTWDNLRRLTQTKAPSPLNYRIQYKYDGNGNRTQMDVENIDKDNNVVSANPWFTTTWAYTTEDQVSSITEEIDATTTRTTTFDHDAEGNRVRITKPMGNKDKTDYNERGLVSQVTQGEGATEASSQVFQYDDNGNLTTVTDGRGNDITHQYDLFDRRIKTTDQAGHYGETDYNENGAVTEVRRKDSGGTLLQRSTRHLDERGQHWKTSDLRKDPATTFADAITTIERRKNGQILKVTDAVGATTTAAFDVYGRVSSVTDALGNVRSSTRDSNGNVTGWSIQETDGTSTVTHDYEATFDVLNRMATHVEIDRLTPTNKLTTVFGRDSRSNLVWQVDPVGSPERSTFDGLGRLLKRERALTLGATIEDFTTAQVTQWGFDANDRMNSHKDDGLNETTWSYDALDRVLEMVYPDLTKITYQYDKNSNIIKTTDAAGNVIDDTFDVRNLNTSRAVTLVSGFGGTTSETRTFDALGRLAMASDNDYKVTLEHGVIGLSSTPYKETQEYVGGTAYAVSVTTTTDAAGRKVSETYPSGLNLTYGRSTLGALSSISDGTNTIASYTWQGDRMTGSSFQNGTTLTNAWTGYRGEIQSIHHKNSTGGTVAHMEYGYDANHDRLYERFGPSGSGGNGFAYDRLRRLTTAWMGSSTPSAPTTATYTTKIDFNMDDDGNRSSKVTTPYGGSATTENYTTNNLNQYTAVGGTTRAHDGNGSLSDDGTYLFKYDYRGQIIEARLKSDNSLVATYKFDALGRRVEKDIQTSADRYVYSGSEIVETRAINGGWRQRYVFRDQVDSVVMLEQSDVLDFDTDGDTTELTRSFYHANDVNSVVKVTDMGQGEACSYQYSPLGVVSISRLGVVQSTDPLGQIWGFCMRQTDAETALVFARQSGYDPAMGRMTGRLMDGILGYTVGQARSWCPNPARGWPWHPKGRNRKWPPVPSEWGSERIDRPDLKGPPGAPLVFDPEGPITGKDLHHVLDRARATLAKWLRENHPDCVCELILSGTWRDTESEFGLEYRHDKVAGGHNVAGAQKSTVTVYWRLYRKDTHRYFASYLVRCRGSGCDLTSPFHFSILLYTDNSQKAVLVREGSFTASAWSYSAGRDAKGRTVRVNYGPGLQKVHRALTKEFGEKDANRRISISRGSWSPR